VQAARRQCDPELSIDQGIARAIKYAQAGEWRQDEVNEFTTNPLLRPALLRHDRCRRFNASILSASSVPTFAASDSATRGVAASTSRPGLADALDSGGAKDAETDAAVTEYAAALSLPEASATATSAAVDSAAPSKAGTTTASSTDEKTPSRRFAKIFRKLGKAKPKAVRDPNGEDNDETHT
jgi:hypothetical protein